MLFGYIVIDRASWGLNEYFEAGVLDRDEAAGYAVTIWYLGGDPAKSGPHHLELMSPELRSFLEAESQWYAREIRARGLEQHYRLQEHRRLRETLNLTPVDIPLIAFMARQGTQPAGVLRIREKWWESTRALNAFDWELRRWLESEPVQQLGVQELDGEALITQLRPLLATAVTAIDAAVNAHPRGRVAKPGASVPDRFPTPPDSTWRDVTIRVGSDRARITVQSMVKTVTYREVGMVDLRTNKPNKQWDLLKVFAMRNGSLTWLDSEADRKNQKRRERLGDALSEYLGIPGDPFRPIEGGWQARFDLSQM